MAIGAGVCVENPAATVELIRTSFFTVGVYEEGYFVSRIMYVNAVITICYPVCFVTALEYDSREDSLILDELEIGCQEFTPFTQYSVF
jgi:hypothetical protein